ncbi:hypothetical protein HX091_06250 [Myroides odoratimimus]|uniref:hypothetical protein n=1 Tax=Myroides odoratimimus TaxID=76832 RepID=UPI0025752CE3|nr:hypothetical protein [Myroides odoratimimus]MDM1525550.1 hypothetical protein [Myroides odoratimimus]
MIKTNISNFFSHHICLDYSEDIYISDYTEKTKNITPKRGVEIFSPNFPNDNQYFSIKNPESLEVTNIIFDNKSFIYSNRTPKSQCETCSFPKISSKGNWILFTELKYSSKPANNEKNLKKAIRQLYKTRNHYLMGGVFKRNEHPSYLIGSLPLQGEPFANFSITQPRLTELKDNHNVILRLTNKIEIFDENILLV